MPFGITFLILAGILLSLAVVNGGWNLLLFWPAISAALVSAGYFRLGPGVFGKQSDGTLKWTRSLLLFPYLLVTWCLWHIVRRLDRSPPYQELTENVLIGRRLLADEMPHEVAHVIELTCEFPESRIARQRNYFCVPILDGTAPSRQSLNTLLEHITRLQGRVYIHCAQGYGRTGLVAAGLVYRLGLVPDTDAALQLVQSVRPGVKLSPWQANALKALEDGTP